MNLTLTALITGASGGLGFAFAKELAAKNYNLILVSSDEKRLKASASQLEGRTSGFVTTIAIDLSQPASARALYDQVIGAGYVIDLLINNAGFASAGHFIDLDAEIETKEMTLNMLTPALLCKLFGKAMASRAHGRILNVASLAAFAPGPYMSIYYATKAFLFNFSLALAHELKRSGVTVSVLCPGPIATDFAKHAHITKTPLFKRRLPSAEQVAKAGLSGMFQDRPVIFHKGKSRLTVLLVKLLPLQLVLKITSRLNGKT